MRGDVALRVFCPSGITLNVLLFPGDAFVLAVSEGADPAFVAKALMSNPQGNAAEQTPIVLIRPPGIPMDAAPAAPCR